MKTEMMINVLQPEESRIAIVEDGVLEELYVERSSLENYVGNIYKYYLAYRRLRQMEEEREVQASNKR